MGLSIQKDLFTEVLTAVTIFWEAAHCVWVQIYRRFGETYNLLVERQTVNQKQLAISKQSALRMEAVPSFEKPVNFYQTT